MSDLAQWDTTAAANGGFDITLRHPGTGEDLDITIGVYGRDSDAFKAIQSRQNKVRIEKMRRAGRVLPIDQEQMDDDNLELLSGCTFRWSKTMELEGKPLDFSVQNARMVYERFPWIYEQVNQGIGDRANFTKPQPAASLNLPNTTSPSE